MAWFQNNFAEMFLWLSHILLECYDTQVSDIGPSWPSCFNFIFCKMPACGWGWPWVGASLSYWHSSSWIHKFQFLICYFISCHLFVAFANRFQLLLLAARITWHLLNWASVMIDNLSYFELPLPKQHSQQTHNVIVTFCIGFKIVTLNLTFLKRFWNVYCLPRRGYIHSKVSYECFFVYMSLRLYFCFFYPIESIFCIRSKKVTE